MPRRLPQNRGDQPLYVDLDSGFVGVNDKVDPSLLRNGGIVFADGQSAAGLAAAAQNNRFVTGHATTRPASVMPRHFNPWLPGVNAGMLGVGIYAEAEDKEWLAMAAPGALYLLADGYQPQIIPLQGVTLSGSIGFTKAGNNLFLWRGTGAPPLVWNGDRSRSPYVADNPPPDLSNPEAPRYLKPAPAAAWGFVDANGDRLWVPYEGGLAWSDIYDYNSFDLSLNNLQFISGNEDSVIAALPLESSIVVWTSRAIFALNGVTGDLSALSAERINSGIGCLARESVAQVGADVLWLADGGVYRLSQAFETRLQANPVPVSDAIDRTMARLNWNYAEQACGIVVDRYYYLAVPMDNSRVNNAILVYDTTTGQWQGVDVFADGMDCRHFVKTRLHGRVVPFMLDGLPPVAGIAPGRIIALDQTGDYDRRNYGPATHNITLGDILATSPQLNIEWSLTTRAYDLNQLGFKRLQAVTAAWSQQGGNSRITLIGEGQGENRILQDWRVYNRLVFTKFGLPNFAPRNTTDTFSAAGREDYTLLASDGTELRSGFPLQARQHYQQTWPFRREARWVAFRFENNSGHFQLKAVAADGLGETNTLHRRN